MAMQLIDAYSRPFDLDAFQDDYEVALRELIDAKQKDVPLPAEEEEPEPTRVINLMDALRESVSKAKRPVASERRPVASERRPAQKGPVLVGSGKRRRRASMSLRASTRAADAARTEAPLTSYRSRRDFQVTAEPSGAARERPRAAEALPFVVQKHAARRLHYDFRLAWDGVLKSWAVAKGPSYYPGDKRLAVQVEDHPLEYRDFEGTIPKGQYGGGTVMVWDKGYWTPRGDVNQGLEEGNLKFELHGEKLRGNWALIRMRGTNERPGHPNWLLIKEKDEFVRESSAKAITEEAPNSAASGRSMEQIAAAKDRVWNSNGGNGKPAAAKPADGGKLLATATGRRRHVDLSRIPREPFPDSFRPNWRNRRRRPRAGMTGRMS